MGHRIKLSFLLFFNCLLAGKNRQRVVIATLALQQGADWVEQGESPSRPGRPGLGAVEHPALGIQFLHSGSNHNGRRVDCSCQVVGPGWVGDCEPHLKMEESQDWDGGREGRKGSPAGSSQVGRPCAASTRLGDQAGRRWEGTGAAVSQAWVGGAGGSPKPTLSLC